MSEQYWVLQSGFVMHTLDLPGWKDENSTVAYLIESLGIHNAKYDVAIFYVREIDKYGFVRTRERRRVYLHCNDKIAA